MLREQCLSQSADGFLEVMGKVHRIRHLLLPVRQSGEIFEMVLQPEGLLKCDGPSLGASSMHG